MIKKDLYNILLIRKTEELISNWFQQNKISGTTHLYIGQEANAVGIIGQLDPLQDIVISNHRCHGHYLAFQGSLKKLLLEILGKQDGVCKGYGGSQHLRDGNFYSNGIQGSFIPIGCGLAFAKKLKKESGIVVICLGDGTLGQGVLYESLNISSLWNLPILFLVENNQYAQSTHIKNHVAGSIKKRANSFNIKSSQITTTDVVKIKEWSKDILSYVRTYQKPYWCVINTNRLCAHSKFDDFRTKKEIQRIAKKDPLLIIKKYITMNEYIMIENKVDTYIQNIVNEICGEI